MPALSLSSVEHSTLRSQAHALKPVVLIGAKGLTDAVMAEIKVHLTGAHQLIIMIRVFGDERDTRIAIYEDICDRLNAAQIQHIGKLLVIWRPEEDEMVPVRGRRGVPLAREAAKFCNAEPATKYRVPPRWSSTRPPTRCASRGPPTKAVVRGRYREAHQAKKRQQSAKRPFQNDK
ncbi:MAG: YhbY family RNA-binding protein [Burkholderia sp.]